MMIMLDYASDVEEEEDDTPFGEHTVNMIRIWHANKNYVYFDFINFCFSA